MTNNAVAVIRARLNLPDTEAFIHAFAPMISPGGMFVRTSRLKEVGATIRFEFSLTSGERLLLGEGVVRQVRDGSEGPSGMLIKFTKLNRASKNLVDRVVSFKRAQSASGDAPSAPVASASVAPAAPQQRPASGLSEEVGASVTPPEAADVSERGVLEDRDDPPSAGRFVSPGRVLSALRQQVEEEHEAQPPGVQLNEPSGESEPQGFSFGLDESEVDDVLGNLFGSMDNDEGPSLGSLDGGALRDPNSLGVVSHAAAAVGSGDEKPPVARHRHGQVPFSDTLHAYPVPVENTQAGDITAADFMDAAAADGPGELVAGEEVAADEPAVVAAPNEGVTSNDDGEVESGGVEEVAGAEASSADQEEPVAHRTMIWRAGDIHEAAEGRLRVDEDGGLQALGDDGGAGDVSLAERAEVAAASQTQGDELEAAPLDHMEAQDDDNIMAVDIDLSDFDDAQGESSGDASGLLEGEPGDQGADELEPDEVTEPFAEQVVLDDGALDEAEQEGGDDPGGVLQIDPGELSEPAFPNEYMDAQPPSAQPVSLDEGVQADLTGGGEVAASMASGEAPLMEDDDAQSHGDEGDAADRVDHHEDAQVALTAEGDGHLEGAEVVESDVFGQDGEAVEEDGQGEDGGVVEPDESDVFEQDGEAVEDGERDEDGGVVEVDDADDGARGEEDGVAFEDAEDIDFDEDSEDGAESEFVADVAAEVFESDAEAYGDDEGPAFNEASDGVEDAAVVEAVEEGEQGEDGGVVEPDESDVFEQDGEAVEEGGQDEDGGVFELEDADDGARGEEDGVAFEDAEDIDFDEDSEDGAESEFVVDVAAEVFEGDAEAYGDDEGPAFDEASGDVEAPLSGEGGEAVVEEPSLEDEGVVVGASFVDEASEEGEDAPVGGGAQLISTMDGDEAPGLGSAAGMSSALIESVSALQALDLPPEESASAPKPAAAPTASRELGSLLDEIHGRAGQKPASASDLLSGLNLATQPGKGLETLSEESPELEDEGAPSFEGLLSAVRKEIDARDHGEDEEQVDEGDALLDQVLKDSTRIASPRPANLNIPTPAESDLLGNKKRKRGFFSRFFGGDE